MSKSSTPSTSFSAFTKRRRAYIACLNCRQRKIKCMTVSDSDNSPCTRCAQKGLTCHYITVPESESSSRPGTPPSDRAPQLQNPDSGWSYEPGITPITPPSAGLSGLIGDVPSRVASPDSNYPLSNPTYPPDPIQSEMYRSNSLPATSRSTRIQRQRHRSLHSAPYPLSHSYEVAELMLHPMSNFDLGAFPQTPSASPSNTFDHAESGQSSAPMLHLGTSYRWTESIAPIDCICPPGPCFCGAQLNWY
ncbi:hypothetical protein C8R44DRAFT_881707 [Mycena epipterygia]|nr:hypothetical protein C8R44DRAFT_881707 [Mycena epipterygia]